MIAVDDWGHGEDGAVLVVDDGVDWGVANDGQEAREVLVLVVEVHHFARVHGFSLVEGRESDILWWQGFVGEGSFDCIQVVGAN